MGFERNCMMRWSLLMRRRLWAVVSRLVGGPGAEGDDGEAGDESRAGGADRPPEEFAVDDGKGMASASTQWAKPVRSPSGNWLRYSSHFDNKGIMEDADRPIASISL